MHRSYERLFAIIAMIIGSGLFGFILSSMTTLLSDTIRGGAQMQAKLTALHQFMDTRKLPMDLQMRVFRHFRYCWSKNHIIEASGV